MANMSYCRFQNTLNDLQDCEDHLGDEIEDSTEKRARERLIQLCQDIVEKSGIIID
jgi:hypothetical protein